MMLTKISVIIQPLIMNSPPTSPEYSTFHQPQQAKTRTESCDSNQNSSIYYLNQSQQAECRTISTIPGNSTNSGLYHHQDDPANKMEITINTKSLSTTFDPNELSPLTPTNSRTLNSRETIALSPTTTHANLNSRETIALSPTTTHANLNFNELISIQPTTTTTTIIAPTSFSPSSPDILADAVPPLSLPISSSTLAPPPPLIIPNSTPPAGARQLNHADIRPLVETIDRTALPSPASYPQPPLSRIEGAEILLEIRYGRRERSRDGTVEPEPEPEKLARPDKTVCGGKNGNGANKERGPRGGTLWGSRLRAKTKRSVKFSA